MKNKRNTRRGRAKRWAREQRVCGCYTMKARRAGVYVLPSGHYGRGSEKWVVVATGTRHFFAEFASRPAAMRCAESNVRLLSGFRRADGLWLAA